MARLRRPRLGKTCPCKACQPGRRVRPVAGANDRLVSVVVPLYNHARFIRSALDSVKASSHPDLELLVLDDGSRDRSFEEAQAWVREHGGRFSKARVWHSNNRGLTATLNELVRQANGRYICILASDDRLTPNGIAVRFDALERHPGWLAAFGDAEVIDGDGRKVNASGIWGLYGGNTGRLSDQRSLRRELILRWCIPGPVFLVRREAYDLGTGIGPYDERYRSEDRHFALRLLALDALGFVPATVAEYRIHGANTVRQDAAGNARLVEEIALQETELAPRFFGLDARLLRLVARFHAESARMQRSGRFSVKRAILKRQVAVAYAMHAVLSGLRVRTGQR